MERLRVLVVDDDPINREVAYAILEAMNHEILVASNGAEAVTLCIDEGQRFDLILMDVIMPVMDGLEAISLLRAHPATRGIAILCISALASEADQMAGQLAGSDHYLTKPYTRQQFLDAMTSAMTIRSSLNRLNLVDYR